MIEERFDPDRTILSCGNTLRDSSVDKVNGGIKATKRYSCFTGIFNVSTCSSSMTETVKPPKIAGATLSGCPSIFVASSRIS